MVIGTGSNIFVKSDVVKGIHGFDESFGKIIGTVFKAVQRG